VITSTIKYILNEKLKINTSDRDLRKNRPLGLKSKPIILKETNQIFLRGVHEAYEILKMMRGVIEGGTGSSLRSAKFGNIHPPTAGKTGTTQNNSDGWFIGITPNLVTGVWVGAEDRAVRFQSMTWGQGARMALPIYGYYMQRVYKDAVIALSTSDFLQPEDYDAEAYDCTDAPQPETVDESEVPFEF
jgi:membrane carboxypeptidase/penicillin-binding protein